LGHERSVLQVNQRPSDRKRRPSCRTSDDGVCPDLSTQQFYHRPQDTPACLIGTKQARQQPTLGQARTLSWAAFNARFNQRVHHQEAELTQPTTNQGQQQSAVFQYRTGKRSCGSWATARTACGSI